MCRYVLLSVALLLFLSPLVLCQPEMPDMPPMGGDDMFDLQGAELLSPTLAYDAPFASKKAAPVLTKAPRMRLTAVPYTYEKPVTHYETVAVPTTQIVDEEVLHFQTVPVTSGKKGYGGGGYGGGGFGGGGYGGGGYGGFGVEAGGYHGAGLWEGPGGLWPGLGYGLTGGYGWSPLGALGGFGSFGKIGWGGYGYGSPWLYGGFAGLAALGAGGGGEHGH